MKTIVKRKGHTEVYDSKKLYASIYAACMTLRVKEKEAELIAQNVEKEVAEEIHKHETINSNHILKLAHESLKKYNQDAAYMYKTHLDIS